MERLYILSKYAHLKGTALSNSLICHSMVFFNPLTCSLYPLTGGPLTKFLNPLTIEFFTHVFFWGSCQNSIRLWLRDEVYFYCIVILDCHCFITWAMIFVYLLMNNCLQVLRQFEIYRRIYYGGMSHSIRKQVWPYLLGHYKFGSTKVPVT